jgi:hypothetical protein
MNRNNSKWPTRVLTSAIGAALLLAFGAPDVAEAQRSGPRGAPTSGGDRSSANPRSNGGSSDSSNGGGERRAARPQPSPASQSTEPRRQAATAGRDEQPTSEVTPRARRQDVSPRTGVAVERRPFSRPDGRIIVPGGWYPWGWGGYGFAGYYGFRDPWYSRWPWYGGTGYGYGPYMPQRDDGSVRLKVSPRDASVYVDGYYAGSVDDFDGVFQSLPLEPGPHRIEVQLDGFAPLTFDVRVLSDRRTTLEGRLRPLAP